MGIHERRKRERERRKRQILDAAWEVTREVGWTQFSVERVAAKAELGRATVYRYFESSDALLEAMAAEGAQRLSKPAGSAEDVSKTTPPSAGDAVVAKHR